MMLIINFSLVETETIKFPETYFLQVQSYFLILYHSI